MKLWRLNVSWQPPAISDEQHLARLYRKLRRFGVPSSAAKVTIDDLRGDMVEAGSLAALTGADLDRFAADVAREHGRAPVPGRHWLIVPLMAAPMLLVAFLTYVFVAGGGVPASPAINGIASTKASAAAKIINTFLFMVTCLSGDAGEYRQRPRPRHVRRGTTHATHPKTGISELF